jgi:hypothetical protein
MESVCESSVAFCFSSSFCVRITIDPLPVGVVAIQIIQLEMKKQELWKSTQLCLKV